ncbi:MAG: hypothetical protein JW825_04180 [Candidatus Methanofastidiosa archaeon]|nr:hypothetical protein [Candidatus Methanofastidiosa archaeon]
MAGKDISKQIIEYYVGGMHPNEIAARLLLDLGTVEGIIEEHECSVKTTQGQQNKELIEDELRRGISSLWTKMERLFDEGRYDQYNTAYRNWLDSVCALRKMVDERREVGQ